MLLQDATVPCAVGIYIYMCKKATSALLAFKPLTKYCDIAVSLVSVRK